MVETTKNASLASHRSGIAYIVSALAVLIILDACGKFAVQRFPVTLTVWSRYVGHVIAVVVCAYPILRGNLFRTANPKLQIARGLLLATMTMFYFSAMKTLPLAHATAIMFITPALITLWAKFFLHETVSLAGWLAVAVGFVGVLIVCRPSGGLDGQGVVYALLGALANSVYQTLTRRAASGNAGVTIDAPATQLFYAGLAGAVVLTATMPAWYVAPAVNIDFAHWFALIALGIIGAVGHFLLTKAFQAAPAATLAPWMYVQILFSIAVGWAIFGDRPDAIALIGMAFITLAPKISNLKIGRAAVSK
jgi:drug/metabolite transporter (DMT)-like permease